MTPAEFSEALRRYGRIIKLVRVGPAIGIYGGAHKTAVEMPAVIRGWTPNEIVDGMIQGARKVIISNAAIVQEDWPGPPVMGDQVWLGDECGTVHSCDTIEVGGVVVRHDMVVVGF